MGRFEQPGVTHKQPPSGNWKTPAIIAVIVAVVAVVAIERKPIRRALRPKGNPPQVWYFPHESTGVQLHCKPIEITEKRSTAFGEAEGVHARCVSTRYIEFASLFRYPLEVAYTDRVPPEPIVREEVDRILGEFHARPIEDHQTMFRGSPGRDIIASTSAPDFGDATMRLRVQIFGPNLYTMYRIVPKDDDTPEDAETFFFEFPNPH